MKNADKPIHPSFTVNDHDGGLSLATTEAANRGMIHHGNVGLTKREYFAGLAMQGWISGRKDMMYRYKQSDLAKIAEKSVQAADELLKHLEKSDGSDI